MTSLDELGRASSLHLVEQSTRRIDVDSARNVMAATMQRRRRRTFVVGVLCLALVAVALAGLLVVPGQEAAPAHPGPTPSRLTGNGVIAAQVRSGWVSIDPSTGTVADLPVDAPVQPGMSYAEFSPDGLRMAYTLGGRGYLHDLDGEHADQLVVLQWGDSDRPLAYTAAHVVWRADGRTYTVEFPPHFAQWATWSPDGTQIAYLDGRGGRNTIVVMNADGSNPIRLPAAPTPRDFGPYWLTWSPDGSTIAYLEAGQRTSGGGPAKATVMTIDPNGDHRRVIGSAGQATDDKVVGPVLVWSPDSQSVAFHGFGVGNDRGWGLYVMQLDGTTERMPVHRLRGMALAWQPVFQPPGES